MRIDILTIFPEMFSGAFASGIVRRAAEAGTVELKAHDIRAFAADKHRSVDDVPYGGGAGMVMRPEPLVAAIEAVPRTGRSLRILLAAQGVPFTQARAQAFAGYDQLILVCGRYEGVDERVREGWIDQECSIGDYVLTGGEFAAMVVADAVVRLLPGVVGNAVSLTEESHAAGLLEYPQYTRPAVFRGMAVPEVLVSGNHRAIAAWRRERAIEVTWRRRPDLLAHAELTEADLAYIERLTQGRS